MSDVIRAVAMLAIEPRPGMNQIRQMRRVFKMLPLPSTTLKSLTLNRDTCDARVLFGAGFLVAIGPLEGVIAE